jgi:hypothetical protein
MCSKFIVASAAAVVLLTGAPITLARDWSDERDNGPNAHQTELDEQYTRTHQAIPPRTPVKNTTSYGYVSPHHRTAKHPLPTTGTPKQ